MDRDRVTLVEGMGKQSTVVPLAWRGQPFEVCDGLSVTHLGL